MRRFIITVLVATILHTTACILMPPYEWGTSRLECFYYALRSGLVAFPIVVVLLLFPLRACLRRLLPRSSQYTHAVVAGLVLMLLIAAMILPRQLAGLPVKPFQHSYVHKWVFWSLLVLAVDLSFFWPFQRTAASPPRPSHPEEWRELHSKDGGNSKMHPGRVFCSVKDEGE